MLVRLLPTEKARERDSKITVKFNKKRLCASVWVRKYIWIGVYVHLFMCIYTTVRACVCVQTSMRFSVKESRARAVRKIRCSRLCDYVCVRVFVCVCTRDRTPSNNENFHAVRRSWGGWLLVCVCVGEWNVLQRGGYGRQSRWLEHDERSRVREVVGCWVDGVGGGGGVRARA